MSSRRTIIVVASTVALLMSLALLPKFIKSRTHAAKESCISLLREIDGASQVWQEEHHKGTNEVPTWEDLKPYCRHVPLVCPQGGSYTLGALATEPTCSIPIHSLNFGYVVVADETGSRLADAAVTVYQGQKEQYQERSGTNGVARVASFPASMVDSWSDGTRMIEVSKEGYESATSPVTVRWPIRFKLKKKGE